MTGSLVIAQVALSVILVAAAGLFVRTFASLASLHLGFERDRVLVVGQEYRPPFYGHVFMFLLRDHLISPFTTGYEGTAIESLYPSNTDMFRKAKAQGATV